MRMPNSLDADYVDEAHMQAFAQALQADDLNIDANIASPTTYPSTPVPQSPRVRKVSALSDFAPVNVKVRRRKRRKANTPGKKQDWLYLIVRWPLLGFLFSVIAAQFGFYILIRQLVNTKEWLSAWRGRKGVLRKRLRGATTYQEWKEAAITLDEYMNFDEWKKIDEDPFYDWKLVRKVNRSLKTLRQKKDTRGILGVLETCIRNNFAGVESPRLYSETYLGTKDLVESYYDELENALNYIRETPELSNEEKKKFFKSANTNLGTSALCLSGGGSFGYYHFGVVKAFLDANLLPRVVAGTSAGGLIAALVCTRTDSELRELLVPRLANRLTACEEPFGAWIKRFWKTGARFDSILWARKCTFFTRGSMTFREAYLRTGRILNISVIPADRHSPTKLLNYVTAPDTIIWSALLASAAVPGILNPVVLMQKLPDGSVVPWNWGSKFKDGSLRVDIPVQALNLYFNVTHPVVSQVNPHVHLFFFAPRGSAGKPVAHRKGKGWRGNFILSAAEQWLKLELTKNFKVIRDLELLPQLLGQDWSSVFLQRFEGAVTIWPRTRILDWIHILTDPDSAELERMMRVGQIVAWPKLHMIQNRIRIEKRILQGRQSTRKPGDNTRTVPTGNTLDLSIGDLPEPVTGTRLPTFDDDTPLPADSEMETAFSANGTAWYFRRGKPEANHAATISGAPSSHKSHGRRFTSLDDPLRSPRLRRKWARDLLDQRGESNDRSETNGQDVKQDMSEDRWQHPRSRTASSPSLFARLRPRPISSFTSLYGSREQEKRSGKEQAADYESSSDSDSDDDIWHEGAEMTRSLTTSFNGAAGYSPIFDLDGSSNEQDEPESLDAS